MLQISIAQRAHPTPFPLMSEAELYEAATSAWVLNPNRASSEQYALVVGADGPDGAYLMAIEIADVRRQEGRQGRYIIDGHILKKGNPVYDAYVGAPAMGTRNPIHYFDSPFDLTPCLCGCGEETRSDFLPGHDQRAIHERIKRFGSVARFLKWFDTAYPPE